MKKLYGFDPRDGVPAAFQAHVLGSEGCNWSAGTLTADELQFKMWPRGAALAETLWTPRASLGYEGFLDRLAVFLERYGESGTGLFDR